MQQEMDVIVSQLLLVVMLDEPNIALNKHS